MRCEFFTFLKFLNFALSSVYDQMGSSVHNYTQFKRNVSWNQICALDAEYLKNDHD